MATRDLWRVLALRQNQPMRCGALLAVAAVCASTLSGQVPLEEYRSRREAAQKALGGAVLVLFGRTAAEMEQHSTAGVQEPDFYYLSGWNRPGAILLLSQGQEILFLPGHNPDREKYTCKQPAATDTGILALTGFERVLPVEQFETQLLKALESSSSISAQMREPYAAKLRALAPLRELSDAAQILGPLRAKKSAAEIERIQKSTGVTVEAHRAAWRRVAAGVFEYQVAAAATYSMLDQGCEGNAYDPIVASGPNATALHYSANSRRMEAGELVLMDAGARCSAYASDVTRTVPVSGHFTPRQRELYEVVLGAQKAAIAAVKPGATLPQLNKIAHDYLDAHGQDLHGEPLGKYLTHRISHGVGLEVHDYPVAASTDPLEAGMVITVEPGLYLPEENIGIRIEDTLLVTSDGAQVLSAALPKEPAEIEKAMAR
jgi:Xaa-Pro aminopeptidase